MINLYALFDRVVGEYMSPVCAVNDASAVRMVADTAAKPGTPLSAHPADHALFRLGTYDSLTGRIVCETQPQLVVQVASLVQLPSVQVS